MDSVCIRFKGMTLDDNFYHSITEWNVIEKDEKWDKLDGENIEINGLLIQEVKWNQFEK